MSRMDRVFKTSTTMKIRIGIVIGIGLCAIVAAAEPNQTAPATASPTTVTTTVGGEEVQTQVEGGRAKLIAFEKNSTIKDALRILAALYEKNIVPSGKVEGVLGFTKLRDVTFEEAMEAILGGALVYQQEGQLIKVYGREEYKKVQEEALKAQEVERNRRKAQLEDPNRLECHVYTLYYISAKEAGALIQSVLSPNGILKTSSPPDKALPTGQSITGGSSGGDSMALNDVLVIKDYPENIAKVEAMLKQLDVRPKQVLVEATIMTANLTNTTKFGVDWSNVSGISGLDMEMATAVSQGGESLTIGIAKGASDVIIEALEEISNATVLANPKILAVNKQLGQVYIGEKLPYRESTTVGMSGVETGGSVKFLDTGTKLTFRPYIGNDGYIRMDIHPKVSTGTLKTDTQGFLPDEKATELATNIIVKDGQTVVIGGLFRDSITKSKNQVPLLGNLPLLGIAFRGSSDSVEREEVIVLLTPHILDEPDHDAGEAAKTDVERKRAGAKKELMPIDYTRITEEAYMKGAKAYLDGDKEQALRHLRVALAVRPTYLEAIRLKERILSECAPEEYQRLERIILEDIAVQTTDNP